jgi:hypothetical protein
MSDLQSVIINSMAALLELTESDPQPSLPRMLKNCTFSEYYAHAKNRGYIGVIEEIII